MVAFKVGRSGPVRAASVRVQIASGFVSIIMIRWTFSPRLSSGRPIRGADERNDVDNLVCALVKAWLGRAPARL